MKAIKDDEYFDDYICHHRPGISTNRRRVLIGNYVLKPESGSGLLPGWNTKWGYYLSEIGKITQVEDTQAWLEITNEDGLLFSMKKVYYRWRQVQATALEFMEKEWPVVLECGWSSPPDDYFRQIYVDNDRGRPVGNRSFQRPLLVLPDSKLSKNVAAHWIHERRMIQELAEEYRVLQSLEFSKLQDKLDQHKRAGSNIAAQTKKYLQQNWDEFAASKHRHIPLNKRNATHVHRVMALRLGIDVTGKSRLKVTPERHVPDLLEGNYVMAKLPEYDDRRVLLAINWSKKTKQYYIASCENLVEQWHNFEPQGAKDRDEPIDWFLKQHDEIMDEIYPPTVVGMVGVQAAMKVGAVVVKTSG